jgi:hypothetical protein
MIKETMNTTTNLFILLIVTLVIFAATTIRYAQAQPGCCEPATPPRPTPGVGGTVAQSMENNATSPSGSTASNNTGNATR